ncbi:TPA: YidC/Oxa1 family membrane protein insertase [Photobacterium damselae]
MLSLLYDIFISPLILGMNFVLVNAYSVLHSYGLSIMVLSLVVNTVLLPLYHMADKWQQEEREKQNKMADKVAEIKQAFQGQERFMMLKTLYRQNHYHPIMAVRNSVGFLIQVPFFFAAYQLLSHFPALNGQSFGPFANLSLPDGLLTIGDFHINVMPFVMTGINLISAFVYTKGLSSKDKIQLYVFAGIFLVLLYTSPVGLVLYWTLNNIYSLGKNLVSANADNIESSKFVSLLKAPFIFVGKAYENVVPKIIRDITIIPEIKSPLIFFSSLYIIVILIAAYVPINVYLSDPAFFHITLSDVVKYGERTIVVTLAVFGIIYLCLSEKLKGKITFIITVLSLITLFNVLVPLRNYGSIDSYFLTNEVALGGRKLLVAYDFIIFICTYLVCYLVVVKNILLNNKSFPVLISIILSVYVSYIAFDSNITYELKKDLSNADLPSYNNDLNAYSKNKENIVVIMLDMFTGDHVSKIFKDYPKLKSHFSGFTWYPDTITAGNGTFVSEPSIHGGYDYTVDAINSRSEKIESIVDEIAKGYKVFTDNFGEKGFDISLYGTQFANCDNIKKHIHNKYLKVCGELGKEKDYFPYFMKKNGLKIDLSKTNDNKFLQLYGVMSAFPYILRPYIYQHGSWLGTVVKSYNPNTYSTYANIDLMNDISNTNSKKSTFKYIQSGIPHLPWSIDKNLKLTLNDAYPETKGQLTKVNGIIPEHFYAEAFSLKAISKWIEWLKSNHIYDNTMIILVSDHGEGDSVSLSKAFGIDISGHHLYRTNQGYPGRPHGLLMIKDFNSNEPFTVSNNFMSTADVPSIVCQTIGGCKSIPEDPRLNNEQRILTHSLISKSWPNEHPKTHYDETGRYEVSGSMFNKDNWKKVQ